MEYIQKLRSKVGKEKVLIPATALVILNQKDEVLLHLRNDTLTWGLPGGLMDLGETIAEGVAREALEETGLEIRNPKLYGVFSGTKFEVRYSNGDETAPVVMGFYTDQYSGKIITSQESPKIAFFSFQNLPNPMNEYHQQFVEGFLRFRANKNTPIVS